MFSWLKQAQRYEKEVRELREKVEILERALKHIDLEWTNTYEKFRQLNMRVAKRVKVLEGAEETSATAENAGEGEEQTGAVVPGSTPSKLSPSQQRFNQMILLRRNRR